jgi:hypothetical protein
VGIYLNDAAESQIIGNLLYDTTGIDVRFAMSEATLIGNVLDGRIRERDGGVAIEDSNLVSFQQFGAAYVDAAGGDFRVADDSVLGPLGGSLEVDFCWTERGGAPTAGPMERDSDCDTTRPMVPPMESEEPEEPSEGPDDTDELQDERDEDGSSAALSAGESGGCTTSGMTGAVAWWGLWWLTRVRRRQQNG